MKTTFVNKETVDRKWYVIDAQGLVVGRLAVEIAKRLRGKHKACYTPHIDTGDYIIVVNAEKVRFTGNKLDNKLYYRHSGYPGGIKSVTAGKLLKSKPERILEHAVKGMLPKNRLGRRMLKKMKVYTGPEHPHQAQQPEVITLETRS
jgi:large subunit ribosomal protein L13